MTTTYDILMPGDTHDGGSVVASVWGNDMESECNGVIFAQIILLFPEAPFYGVQEIEWHDGWVTTVRYRFANIVEAVRQYERDGGDI